MTSDLENFEQTHQIEPSQELLDAIENLSFHAGKTRDLVNRVVEIAKREGIPAFLLRDLVRASIEKRGLSASAIRYYLPPDFSKQKLAANFRKDDDNKRIEETSSTTETDDIDETHDQRSENIINDQVNASMNAASENKIRSELQREVESLRQQLEDKEGINELLKREIEESKNLKLEARILDIEQLNRNLKVENEQLRHALTKHSFETAAEVKEKADPDLVANLEFYIKKLEHEANSKDKVIQELYEKIESFSRLDHVVEHQPLELDLTDKGGFLGLFFANRGRKVKVIHDGTKINNILPEVIK
jgi:hypothetical protein